MSALSHSVDGSPQVSKLMTDLPAAVSGTYRRLCRSGYHVMDTQIHSVVSLQCVTGQHHRLFLVKHWSLLQGVPTTSSALRMQVCPAAAPLADYRFRRMAISCRVGEPGENSEATAVTGRLCAMHHLCVTRNQRHPSSNLQEVRAAAVHTRPCRVSGSVHFALDVGAQGCASEC